MMNDADSACVRDALTNGTQLQHGAWDNDYQASLERREPSYMYRPRLFIDGNQWCALYGENLQEGVSGFGDSPALAYADFDRAWHAKLPESKDMSQNNEPGR